jgi:U3 small nucleolar RNA-associated protein 7
MAQNPHSAIIHAGHANGTMTLWSPNMTTPHVKLLAHRGPITGIAVDPSENSIGRYCATAGLDGTVKIWDGRMWGKEVRSWGVRNTPSTVRYSQKGCLAIGGKSGVTVYNKDLTTFGNRAPEPYLTLPLPGLTASSAMFCPYDDVLAVGHGKGISSLLVPGSGEAQFDSNEADVYESHNRRREREVRGVLEKIRPELITMDTEFLGTVGEKPRGTFEEREGRSYRQLSRVERLKLDGKAEGSLGNEDGGDVEGEEGEDGEAEGKGGKKEKEKYKMRGKSGSMKKYLRKKKKNVIDPSLVSVPLRFGS